MKAILGLDIGSSSLKIAIIKNNKLYKTETIDAEGKSPKSISANLKRFLQKNRIKPETVNIMVRDYKTKRIKIEKIRGGELKNALLFEREEKIGTSDILGENYKDNHIIQKKTNNTLDILLAVVNEEEIKKIEEIINPLNIKNVNLYMECFAYNDIVPDNSIIIDAGYSSVQLMFYDKKKVLKTSLMKKGLRDIIADIKDKIDPSITNNEIMQFSLDNHTNDEKYKLITSWLGLYADNIINGINTYIRENAKDMTDISIFYTGGIFVNPKMVDYFNYLMGIDGRLLRVCGQKEEPVLNNSIALAYKTGTRGRIDRGQNEIINIVNHAASYVLLFIFTILAVWGGYNTYRFFDLGVKTKEVQTIYSEMKENHNLIQGDYKQLSGLLLNQGGYKGTDTGNQSISAALKYIKGIAVNGTDIKKLEFKPEGMVVIKGVSNNYTSFGIFCTQLKQFFRSINIKNPQKVDNAVNFEVECRN